MDFEELKYYYAFSRTGKVGPIHFNQALKVFGDAKAAWEAREDELKYLGWREGVTHAVRKVKKSVDLEKELERLIEGKVKIITDKDKEYPPNLKNISTPPFILYIKGEISKKDTQALAVVGSRKITDYGRLVTRKLVSALCLNHLTIISGLALGIDAFAHKEALECGGRTLAVLGSGIDKISPITNYHLAENIISSNNGAIITEFPPGTEAFPSNFPFRNRIISGLSMGVLVIEAAVKSGTLITAGHALDQGKDVFAVPGSVLSSMSSGSHRLIKMGAKLVESAQDILEELNITKNVGDMAAVEIIPESKEEEVILKILGEDMLHIDDIIRSSKLATSVVSSVITMMEIKGKIINTGGGYYRKGRG